MWHLSESRIGRIARRRERLYLAPAGRYVYSTRHAPNLKPQRGDMSYLSESQIRPIQPKTPIKKP